MSATRLLTLAAAAAALIASPAFSDNAKQRSGSSGASRDSGSRHHSGSGARSSGSSASGHSSHSGARSSPSSGSSTLTDAQRRHPRAGTGSGYRYYGYGYGHGHYPYYGGYWGGYYGYPYYGWGYGYYPYGGLYLNSWWAPPYYGYGPYVSDGDGGGAVRVLVDQPKAGVYVDGYYAGVVDDFDGMFQRLHVPPGQHDITIKLEGYKTHNFSVHVPADGTLKLRWEMEPGEGHDGTGDPTLAPPKRDARRERRGNEDDRWAYRDRESERGTDERDSGDRYAERDVFGTLRLDVRPGDASVYVDGAFRGMAGELRTLEVPEGPHRIEIVRPGYRTYDREVDVQKGESVDVTVDLER